MLLGILGFSIDDAEKEITADTPLSIDLDEEVIRTPFKTENKFEFERTTQTLQWIGDRSMDEYNLPLSNNLTEISEMDKPPLTITQYDPLTITQYDPQPTTTQYDPQLTPSLTVIPQLPLSDVEVYYENPTEITERTTTSPLSLRTSKSSSRSTSRSNHTSSQSSDNESESDEEIGTLFTGVLPPDLKDRVDATLATPEGQALLVSLQTYVSSSLRDSFISCVSSVPRLFVRLWKSVRSTWKEPDDGNGFQRWMILALFTGLSLVFICVFKFKFNCKEVVDRVVSSIFKVFNRRIL